MEIIKEIINLYTSPDGRTGGYGHIVFDDENIEDEFIEWCIEEAEKGEYEFICEETRKKSIIALKSLLKIDEENRIKLIQEAKNKLYSN